MSIFYIGNPILCSIIPKIILEYWVRSFKIPKIIP